MILLIFPPFADHLNDYPPLGIAQLASFLEEKKIEVDILDLGINKPDRWKEFLIQKIEKIRPQFVGLSSLTTLYKTSVEIAKFIRENYPEIKIVFGGPHPTARPSEVLKNNFVDYVVRGEGEYTLLELLRGDGLSEIKGLSFKKDGEIFDNPDRELIENLDSLPFPGRHFFDLKKYVWYPEMSLMSSRGCPFACYYCFNKTFGRKFRARSAQNIVEEMEHLNKKYGIQRFYFYDDTFTLDKKRTIDFCNLLLKKNLNFEWRCASRIDTIDDERIQIMKKAGCTKIHFGIESGDPVLIKKIKKITLEQAKQVIKATQDAGISTKCNFIIGHPWDTEETVKRTIKFATELKCDIALFSIATPFPGTELWELAKEMGVIEEGKIDWGTFFVNGVNLDNPIMKTYTLSSEQLLKFYRLARRRWHINKLIKSFSQPRKVIKIIRERGLKKPLNTIVRRIIAP